MPPRNEVPSLRSLGISAAKVLMDDAVLFMSRRLHARGIQVVQGISIKLFPGCDNAAGKLRQKM